MKEERRVDISVLCHNAQTLVNLAEPFTKLTKALDKFRRWESPILCIALLVMATCASIVLSWFHLLLLNLALIGGVAGIGLAHLRGNILLKVLPSAVTADQDGVYSSELPSHSHSQTMHQFKEILYLTDALVFGIARMIERLYSVIKWDDFHHSVRCYSIAAVLVTVFHILPFKYTVALCVDVYVVYYPIKCYISDKYWKIKDLEEKELPQNQENAQPEQDTISISQASLPSEDEEIEEDLSSEKSESCCEEVASDAEGMEFGEQQEDTHVEEELEQAMSSDAESQIVKSKEGELSQTNSQPKLEEDAKSIKQGSRSSTELTGGEVTLRSGSQKPTGVVGRLMEFKRKQQQANTGTCVGCGVSFSTILKRKKNCANCGNCFCSKCCSNKVPKSVLGVTSPAQTELVVVCTECHQSLGGGLDTSSTGSTDTSKMKTA